MTPRIAQAICSARTRTDRAGWRGILGTAMGLIDRLKNLMTGKPVHAKPSSDAAKAPNAAREAAKRARKAAKVTRGKQR